MQQHREITPEPTEMLNIASLTMFVFMALSYLV